MKINRDIYPHNIEVKKLPFYLAGIGGSETQSPIVRVEGYHWHQILFSECGKGTLKFDNTTVSIDEGDYIFLPAQYPHEYHPQGEKWDVKWTAFSGYACAHILSQFYMTKPLIIKPNESTALQSIYTKMFTLQKTDVLYCDYACSGLIYDYVIEFHRLLDSKINKVRNERNKLLLPVLNYIDENFRNDFTLTHLAKEAGITPQHLCRIFKESMNMRPTDYVVKRRLREAKRLIQQNELPISEVAIRSGFSDAAYFSTVFKKHEGLTPLEYRKRMR